MLVSGAYVGFGVDVLVKSVALMQCSVLAPGANINQVQTSSNISSDKS